MSTKITPKKAIANFCKECVCGDRDEIRNCTAPNCPLFDFRPYKLTGAKSTAKSEVKAERGKKVMTDEHKAKMKAAKAAKAAARAAAGEPAKAAPAKTKAAPKAKKPAKTTKKAEAARARMTPEHKAKMKAGRLAKKMGQNFPKISTATPAKDPGVKASAGMRKYRGPEDIPRH